MSDSIQRPAPKARQGKLALIGIGAVVLIVVMLVAGYLPRRERNKALAATLKHEKTTLPEVNVVETRGTPSNNNLVLPGNITPITEAVINARAEGYLRRRLVDIGDRVRKGQVLAEVEAPELDQQVQQARASVSQSQANLGRAQHAVTQAQSNLHLADVTVQRWKALVDRGVVSKQEFDQKQAQFESDQSAVESARSDVRAAEDNVRATQANLQRLVELQGYQRITAPFAGVVTARNVDVGSLISTNGSTPLFKIAQTDMLRIMIDVPEQSARYIKVGDPAEITLQEFGPRKFLGRVSRTANSLDANTRTLPTEVQVPNRDYALLPNMFAQVTLISSHTTPALMVPGDALLVRPEGTEVALLTNGNHVHFQRVEVGRDYGPELEIRSGLQGGERVIVNPSDDVREGVEVNPILQKARTGAGPGQPSSGNTEKKK